MERPVCKLCGEAHWSSEPHKWGETTTLKELRESPIRKQVAQRLAEPLREPARGVISCACGCGAVIEIKPRYATAACRQRAKRERDRS